MSSAVVVGSGPNGLAGALVLAAAGLQVTVLEAEDRLGGGVRSAELTLPGLIHDECSAAHPLAVDTPFSRQFDLGAHGLTWRWPEVQYSHPIDGGGAAAYRSVQQTADELGEDGRRWKAIFGPLADRFDDITGDFLRPMLHVPDHPIKMARFGLFSGMPAAVLARLFSTEEGRALWAGTAAHAFRPMTSPVSSAIGVALGTAAHRYGWPVAEGGSGRIAEAMVSLLKTYGTTFETGHEVTSLDELSGFDVKLLDVTPSAALRIAGDKLPRRVAAGYKRFRHGPGTFKVEFAVEGGVPWGHEPSRAAGTVHVCGSFAEVQAAEKAVCSGSMPDRPFVLVCQQSVADPTRAKDGVHPLYAYAHVPHGWGGDATAAIEDQLERFAPGFKDRVLAKDVRDVAATEAHDANWVGGDVVTGANDVLQLVFRPRPALDPYSMGLPGTYLCSAATPPGAGAHGMCGYWAAQSALKGVDGAEARHVEGAATEVTAAPDGTPVTPAGGW